MSSFLLALPAIFLTDLQVLLYKAFIFIQTGFTELRSQLVPATLTHSCHSQPLSPTPTQFSRKTTHSHPFFKKKTHSHPFFDQNDPLPLIFQEKQPPPTHFSEIVIHSHSFFKKNNPLPPIF